VCCCLQHTHAWRRRCDRMTATPSNPPLTCQSAMKMFSVHILHTAAAHRMSVWLGCRIPSSLLSMPLPLGPSQIHFESLDALAADRGWLLEAGPAQHGTSHHITAQHITAHHSTAQHSMACTTQNVTSQHDHVVEGRHGLTFNYMTVIRMNGDITHKVGPRRHAQPQPSTQSVTHTHQ
jgi:hypothetical protein